MIEYLTSRGYTVHLGDIWQRVILTRKERPDLTWDFPNLKAAYDALGGPARHLQYTGGRA